MKAKKWKDIKKLTKSEKQETKKEKPDQGIDIYKELGDLWIENHQHLKRWKHLQDQIMEDFDFSLQELARLHKLLLKARKTSKKELENLAEEIRESRTRQIRINDATLRITKSLRERISKLEKIVYYRSPIVIAFLLALGGAFLTEARIARDLVDSGIAGVLGVGLIMSGLWELFRD